MKIRCFCGKEFDFDVYSFPETQDKDFVRRPCPSCKRSYDLRVNLVQEKPEFWKV